MDGTGGSRAQRRAASETAILDAAWTLFARSGPAGVSLREVADAAGCTHPLIARYFGTKDALVGSVASRLAGRVENAVRRSCAAPDPLVAALATARADPIATRLLIRTALGDLPPRGFPTCLHTERLLDAIAVGDHDRSEPTRRARLCAYAAACTIVGFVTFEGFVVSGTGLGRLSPTRRDLAVAGVARGLLSLAGRGEPVLAVRDVTPRGALPAARTDAPATAAEALLEAAVELFAERGPGATSVRDVAHRAGVNQGLIYRHFGSKDALLAAALDRSVSELFPPALSDAGFDFDTLSWLLHRSSSGPRLLARTLVDGVDITTVRRRFPVLRRLVQVAADGPPGDRSDPRVAASATAAMALGSAVWGEHLRPALGVGSRDGVESAIADLARVLVSAPVAGVAAVGVLG